MPDATHKPLVYYVMRDGLIKIGTTTHFPKRMHDLGVKEVLAVEPGSFDLETGRHSQFDAHHVDGDGELFRPGADLLAHAAALRETYGLPGLKGRLPGELDPELRAWLALLPPLVMDVASGTLERFVEKFTAVDPVS